MLRKSKKLGKVKNVWINFRISATEYKPIALHLLLVFIGFRINFALIILRHSKLEVYVNQGNYWTELTGLLHQNRQTVLRIGSYFGLQALEPHSCHLKTRIKVSPLKTARNLRRLNHLRRYFDLTTYILELFWFSLEHKYRSAEASTIKEKRLTFSVDEHPEQINRPKRKWRLARW